MYFFVVNPSAGRAKLNSIEVKLRDRLKNLGLLGDWAKTTGRADVKTLIRGAEARGFTTIVAVGGDGTFSEVINDTSGGAVIGVIPIGRTNTLAEKLGIKKTRQAPEILAARRTVDIKLARAVGETERYFIHRAVIGSDKPFIATVDGAYTVRGPSLTALIIKNELTGGKLLIESNGADRSRLNARTISFDRPLDGELDNEPVRGITAVELTERSARVIVGKDRDF